MENVDLQRFFLAIILVMVFNIHLSNGMTINEKKQLRTKALEMFKHAYRNYMDHAYPADELMPLSCRGRFRGSEPSRGDVDDALGNFSLTLIDTLDTLVVLGEIEEFETAVRLVINDISFDNDVVVSVFETNIRVVGGLLGGHLMADYLKRKMNVMQWYNDELLHMAEDLGSRLLPAFNTSTGMPYPRVNLRYGVKHEMSRTGSEKDTCTACAGTMLLEFSALSRLTGHRIYEEKAAKAMDYLWESRHRSSDLVGTVINIHNGDWVRRESGIGAGIDSYYEYLLKAYIMLGDDTYLERFNKHYKAVMKYVSNGPLMLDVHMHRPQMNSRNFMDALLAFWPGLQVLKGDLKSAIEIHEILYQVTLRHNFLPEAFTTDFRVHWAQHPLRPEFLESTYFIYKATGDPYYLEVGKSVIENLDRLARVPCGFAAIKDVTTGAHEDQMDSYVLAETFKYLYLLFSEKEDLILNVDDYVFTTEAHLLPLFLSMQNTLQNRTEDSDQILEEKSDGEGYDDDNDANFHNTCPSTNHLFKGKIDFARHLRSPLKNLVENLCPKPKSSEMRRLHASEFMAGNKDQITMLNRMGIRIVTMSDGRVQLLHLSNEAASAEDSADGLLFMQEMIELSKAQSNDVPLEPRVVQLMSPPFFGSVVLKAGPAQFGVSLKNHPGIEGQVAVANPVRGCQPLSNQPEVANKFVMVERGDCMFVDKARHLQNAGAIGGIVFDNNSQSSADASPLFSMSGDGKSDIIIPLVFLFYSEAKVLREALTSNPHLIIYISERFKKSDDVLLQYLSYKSRSLSVSLQSDTLVSSSYSSKVEETASVHDSLDSSTVSETSGPTMEKDVKEIILVLLRKINLEHLEPWIKTRSRDKLELRFGGSFQVRVIRTPDNSDRVQLDLTNEEVSQRIVKVVFTEFLLLLMECTNLGQLKELNQLIDALARLTESVFTNGQMNYGVHTETLISNLKDEVVVSKACKTVAPGPRVPEVILNEDEENIPPAEDAYLSKADDVQMKITISGDDSLLSESQKLKQIIHSYVENELGDIMKDSSSVEVIVSSTNPVAPNGNLEIFSNDVDSGSLFFGGYRLDDGERKEEIKKQIDLQADFCSRKEFSNKEAGSNIIVACDSEAKDDNLGERTVSLLDSAEQDLLDLTMKHDESNLVNTENARNTDSEKNEEMEKSGDWDYNEHPEDIHHREYEKELSNDEDDHKDLDELEEEEGPSDQYEDASHPKNNKEVHYFELRNEEQVVYEDDQELFLGTDADNDAVKKEHKDYISLEHDGAYLEEDEIPFTDGDVPHHLQNGQQVFFSDSENYEASLIQDNWSCRTPENEPLNSDTMFLNEKEGKSVREANSANEEPDNIQVKSDIENRITEDIESETVASLSPDSQTGENDAKQNHEGAVNEFDGQLEQLDSFLADNVLPSKQTKSPVTDFQSLPEDWDLKNLDAMSNVHDYSVPSSPEDEDGLNSKLHSVIDDSNVASLAKEFDISDDDNIHVSSSDSTRTDDDMSRTSN